MSSSGDDEAATMIKETTQSASELDDDIMLMSLTSSQLPSGVSPLSDKDADFVRVEEANSGNLSENVSSNEEQESTYASSDIEVLSLPSNRDAKLAKRSNESGI